MASRSTDGPANRSRTEARRSEKQNRRFLLRRARPFWMIDRDITNRFSSASPEQPVADLYSPVAALDPKREPPPETDPWAERNAPSVTTEQLRDAIDSGRTGDKVNVSDPAAAPLGTDAEAGGHPPSRECIAIAAAEEMAGPETRGIARRPLASATRLLDRPLLSALVVGALVASLGIAALFALGLLP